MGSKFTNYAKPELARTAVFNGQPLLLEILAVEPPRGLDHNP